MYSMRCPTGHSAQFRVGLYGLGAAEFDALDLVLFRDEAGAVDGWESPWPLASDIGGVSAFLHGHEDHRASLALAILARSVFRSSRLLSSSTGSGSRIWAGVVVGGCRHSRWRLASNCAATERDLRRVALGGSPPSRSLARASRRLASRPATTDHPGGLIAILARYWLICGRDRRKR